MCIQYIHFDGVNGLCVACIASKRMRGYQFVEEVEICQERTARGPARN